MKRCLIAGLLAAIALAGGLQRSRAAMAGTIPLAASSSGLRPAPVPAVQPDNTPASSSTAPALWMDVPFVRQTRDGCGSAVISMVMQYWDRKQGHPDGPAADAEKIQAALFSPKAGGIYTSRMRQYFEAKGYRAFAFHGRWSDLRQQVQKGRPLIVGLGIDGLGAPLHYAVVVGIDSERGFVFVNDPAQGKMLRVSKQGFESEWSRTQHWTLLAVPRTRH